MSKLAALVLITMPMTQANAFNNLLAQDVQQPAQNITAESYATELSNVRALPFGYHACVKSRA